jgi:hypothetical protein
MDDDKKDSDDAVGYCKPPKRTRFKPGQSGNPNGRPRKSTTFKDDVDAELRSRINMTENGKPLKITKRRAIAKQLVHKAINGSIGSAKLLFDSTQQDASDKQDNLGALLDEFREKNHHLPTNSVAGGDASIGPADSTSSIDKGGKKS